MLIAGKGRAMSQPADRPSIPKSMRHKRILDAAAAQPEASLEAIATEIPSATADLVEHVLEEYGDPADTEAELPEDPADALMDTETDTVSPELQELTAKQRAIIQVIAEHPDATQQEIAERLDVSAPTICNRVNSIQGFDWQTRQAFVETILETESAALPEEAPDMDTNSPDQERSNGQLNERITALEERIETLSDQAETEATSPSVFDDPNLVHKVVHACMQSESISEEEELQIVKTILS